MDYVGGIFIYHPTRNQALFQHKGGKMKRINNPKGLAVPIMYLTIGILALVDYSKSVPIRFTMTPDRIPTPAPTVTQNIPTALLTLTKNPIFINLRPTFKPYKDMVQTVDELTLLP